MQDKRIQLLLLQAAIELVYNCDARHQESVPVDEQFHGTPIWQGEVEVFEVTGHRKANRCYAWLRRDELGQIRPVALLNKFPINSPESAVRAFMALNASINSDRSNAHELLSAQAF